MTPYFIAILAFIAADVPEGPTLSQVVPSMFWTERTMCVDSRSWMVAEVKATLERHYREVHGLTEDVDVNVTVAATCTDNPRREWSGLRRKLAKKLGAEQADGTPI